MAASSGFWGFKVLGTQGFKVLGFGSFRGTSDVECSSVLSGFFKGLEVRGFRALGC